MIAHTGRPLKRTHICIRLRHMRVKLFEVILAGLLFGIGAQAQLLSYGLKGGVPFSGGFADLTTTSVDVIQRTFSNSKQYIIGPTIELRLPLNLSIEVDALYHPLNLTMQTQIVPQATPFTASQLISSWEIPILGKYRFLPLPIVKPYVEAGPSFRASSQGYLSHDGFTLGGGVEVKLGRLKVGPEIRYIRWGSDALATTVGAFFAPSQLNQAEFLVGLSF